MAEVNNKQNCGVYCIKNLNTGGVYIGSSIELNKRLNHHWNRLKNNKHRSIHLQRAYNKDSRYFVAGIICYCTKEDVIKLEQSFIDLYKGKLYNIRPIANSNSGFKWTEEQKKKASSNYKPKKITDETRRRMSQSAVGKIISDSTRHKMSINTKLRWSDRSFANMMSEKMSEYNKNLTEERKIEISKKISDKIKGLSQTRESIIKRLNSMGAPSIDMFDLDGNFINTFRMAKDAAEYVGGKSGSITDNCKGRQRSYKGFIFKFNYGKNL